MFFVRYKDTTGGPYITVTLAPGPTEVDYPESRLYKALTTQDGAVVVQRPLRDDRPRRWIWRGYRPSIIPYENQWTLLKSLEYRTRLEANKPAEVEIWENATGIGGFDALDGSSNKIWTKVKFLLVDRKLRGGGGRPIYDSSTVEFVISDTTYTAF